MEPSSLYLVVHLPLQLDDLVLHAHVELLEVLGGARLDLQLLEAPFGKHPAVGALDDDGGGAGLAEAPPHHPAAHVLLDDGGFVVHQELVEVDTDSQQSRPTYLFTILFIYRENFNFNLDYRY